MVAAIAFALFLDYFLYGLLFPLLAHSPIGPKSEGQMGVLYGVYAVLIWLLKTDVAPGWTTLSLLLALMLFVFSAQFLFLSEYLVQILSTVPSSSRRQLVAREYRSPLTGRGGRLNVIDAEGEFHLGAPKAADWAERQK